MEDYKEKYEKALKRAKEYTENSISTDPKIDYANDILKNIFPELKESEDERIRKTLKSFFDSEISDYGNVEWRNGIRYGEIVSWLEKQGDVEYVFRPLAGCDIYSAAESAVEQQKSGKKIILAFNGAYIPVDKKTVDEIVNEYYSWCEKQGEQKPVKWSEEDERHINSLIIMLEADEELMLARDYYKTLKDWLKSLKERYTWKPSDEQMEAIRLAAEIGTANNSWAMNILKSMYQDLKRLREE